MGNTRLAYVAIGLTLIVIDFEIVTGVAKILTMLSRIVWVCYATR